MSKSVKVYNKGTRPIVWKRDRNGVEVIHPKKFDIFSKKKAEEVVKKFENACYEDEYKKASVLTEKETKSESKGKRI